MRLHHTLTFSYEEQQVLATAALSVRIAFGDMPDRSDKNLWKTYGGRDLMAMGRSANDRLGPEQVHGAFKAAQILATQLRKESDRGYWEKELRPRGRAEFPDDASIPAGAVGLVAPGTDVCGMLAETRQGQLRQVERAVDLLAEAVFQVGPPDQTEIQESRVI